MFPSTMTIMRGAERRKSITKIAIGDADSIIALVYKNDTNHVKAQNIAAQLLAEKYQIIYPNTAIIEAITTLKRALNLSDKSHFINRQYQKNIFNVEFVSQSIMQRASEIFEETQSKQNTFFDAVVVATAESLDTKLIFSFDKWYSKFGFKLAGAINKSS